MFALTLAAAGLCTLQGDWEKFKIRFGKKYSKDEEELRQVIFSDNVRYAQLLNKLDNTASYGVTRFSDLTAEEFAQRHLGLTAFNGEVEADGECYTPTESQVLSAPKAFDWRDKGVMAPVQDQGQCGSCWAFATVAATEAANAIAGNGLTKLSEQQLVDCDSVQGGCEGGNMYPAEGYVQRNGLTAEASYPYAAVQQKCKSFTPVSYLKNHCLIRYTSTSDTTKIENEMRYHLANDGPVVVGINANKAQLYISGVMNSKNCNVNGVNHAVVAVGYDISASEPYWTIRNSWGATWGEEGHLRMAYGENTCGIATSASYVFA